MKFPRMRIIHLSSNSSDHYPLWIVPDGLDVTTTTKPFRFEEMWLQVDGFVGKVKNWRDSYHFYGTPSYRLAIKLKVLKEDLKK